MEKENENGNGERLWEVAETGNLHYDQADAISEYLDECDKTTIREMVKTRPTLTLVEFKRMEIDPARLGVLEHLLEFLDEEYGNQDGDWTTPTPDMKSAELTFIKAVLKEYEVWQCEPTGKKEEVDILQWVTENEPDWLNEQEKQNVAVLPNGH